MKRYQYPPTLIVARLKWLPLQWGRDGSKLEPVTRSSMYSGSLPFYAHVHTCSPSCIEEV